MTTKRFENVYCDVCKGTGVVGVINQIGVKSSRMCGKCSGIGRISVEYKSAKWKAGKDVIPGLGKRVRLNR